MGDLFGKVLPLALGGAISPTVLTVAVLTLSSAKRPVARGVAYALGFATVLVAFAAAGLAFLGRVNDDHAHHRGAVADTIDIVIGVVLLLFALRSVVARRTGVDTDAPKPPREHQVGLTASFVTGMVMMLTNITTIVLLIPMMKDVDRASASTGAKAVVFAVALLVVSLPATAPLFVRVVAPGPSVKALTALNRFIARHQHTIVVVVEIVFGAYLVTKGLGA